MTVTRIDSVEPLYRDAVATARRARRGSPRPDDAARRRSPSSAAPGCSSSRRARELSPEHAAELLAQRPRVTSRGSRGRARCDAEDAARARQRDPAAPRRGDPPRHPGDRPRGDLLRPDGAGGDRLPAGDRPREHVGARASPRRWPTRSASRCGPSARTRASRPCSTSAAIRAGAAPRRRSARIRTSSRGWASRSCAGSRATSLRDGVVATAKHFVGYGASDGGMNWAPAGIPPRELREVYLHPFEAAVRDRRRSAP